MKTKLKLITAWLIFLLVSFIVIIFSLLYELKEMVKDLIIDIYLWADDTIVEDLGRDEWYSKWEDHRMWKKEE